MSEMLDHPSKLATQKGLSYINFSGDSINKANQTEKMMRDSALVTCLRASPMHSPGALLESFQKCIRKFGKSKFFPPVILLK